MTYYIIYKITNKVNGKIYIGSHKTKNLNDGYMGSGKYLKRAIVKHGLENFEKEILHIFDTPELMYNKEAEIVNEDFLSDENTYNLRKGGYGGFDYINKNPNIFLTDKRLNSLMPIEMTRKIYIEKFYNDNDFAKKVKNNLKTATRISQEKNPLGTFYGKKHSEQTKKIIGEKNSINHIGEKNSQYNTMWITNGVINKKISKNESIPKGWNKGRKFKKI